ncbi:MAG: 16S rRNA (guanine(966)-N(2))-methyltransferase RsmD [Geminicoccaceae bacterium]|nr:16S rRNA (guanine(966)-N(2))-methyltransferase RsmD [Geminicoccaceae bacterium]
MTAPRIIAGRLKGRKLEVPADGSVRPTASRMREALFSMVTPQVAGCRFLDLFSGTGAVGFEACSRGAREVVFVEQARQATIAIKRNATALDCLDMIRIVQGDATLLRTGTGAFDIVFADPPYGTGLAAPAFARLLASGAITTGARLFAELAAREPFDPPDGLAQVDERRFGAGRLIELKTVNDPRVQSFE